MATVLNCSGSCIVDISLKLIQLLADIYTTCISIVIGQRLNSSHTRASTHAHTHARAHTHRVGSKSIHARFQKIPSAGGGGGGGLTTFLLLEGGPYQYF